MRTFMQNRGWSFRSQWRATRIARVLAVALGLMIFATQWAQAQVDTTFSLLYSFRGKADGFNPNGSLLRDTAGNLYGTTYSGGTSGICPVGCGTVFKVDSAGAHTVLHRFAGPPLDGRYPSAGLVRDAAGNFYGTTQLGGASDLGTVFKLDRTGTETVLYSFAGGTDAGGPCATLIRDAAGNLYGNSGGGAFGFGAVFKLDTTGTETVLYSFTGGTDGAGPGGLVMDSAGNLYGATGAGGDPNFCAPSGCGTVFKLDSTGTLTVLYSFAGSPDGAFPFPYASLIRDAAGNLYGTTSQGGGMAIGCNSTNGCGTVFKVDTTGVETVLHSFTGPPDGADPIVGLVLGANGNLYGTTQFGGASGAGTLFRIDITGVETVLHNFSGPPLDGWYPMSSLTRDSAGNFYGTTGAGGASGRGTVFKLNP